MKSIIEILSGSCFAFRDLLAKLEVAIEKVINVVRSANAYARHSHTYLNNDDDDNSSSITTSDNEEVRLKEFFY